MRRRYWVPGTLLVILLLDQWTKLMARGPLREAGPLSYLGGLVRFECVENPGAFLSFGAAWSESVRQAFFHFGVVAILACTAWMLVKQKQTTSSAIGLVCVLAGGIGNLIDRVVKGTVTDFAILGSVDTAWLRTGVFNIADLAIVVGIVLLFVTTSGRKKQPSGALK